MLSISLNNIGKKFGREWIFKNLSLNINQNDKLVIHGGNGSGKSTLLQIISGFVSPSEGKLEFKDSGNIVSEESIKDYISFASPYLQLVEEFSTEEMLEHASKFKPFKKYISVNEALTIIQLQHAVNKPIKQFSSGMKQRLKLGLAILADTPLLLLDEPVSNLDKEAISWYKQMIETYGNDRTVIVCSNAVADEYFFCNKQLDIHAYKPGMK